jgi:hypothetical protein
VPNGFEHRVRGYTKIHNHSIYDHSWFIITFLTKIAVLEINLCKSTCWATNLPPAFGEGEEAGEAAEAS